MRIVLVVTAALVIAGCTTLRVLSRSFVPKPGPATAVVDDAQIRPALVHFVIANCKPGIAAYEATILDLAARGFLSVSAHPTGLWLAYTEAGARAAGATSLAAYEQGVLDSMHGRLKNTGGAPLMALAQACRVDVQGTWNPFDQKLSAEARKRGLCRWRLPHTQAYLTVTALTAAAGGTFAGVLTATRPHASIGSAVIVASITWLIFTIVLLGAGYRERLTTLGAMLAARWTQEQVALATTPAAWTEANLEALQRRAFAVALSVPGAGLGPPGRAGRVVSERPSDSKMPSQAWSSFTGSWRLVQIEKTMKAGMAGAVNALVLGIIIGFVDFLVLVLAGYNSWEVFVAAVAAAFAVPGAINVARISAIPTSLTFNAQVIARWVISNGSDGTTPYYAVDDGVKAWVFTGAVALEDVLRITVNPRNGQLIESEVIAHQRPETPVEVTQPTLPMLTDAEVAELIGPVSRTIPVPNLLGSGTLYHGQEGTLTLTVTRGGLAGLSKMISSKAGTPLAGLGDAAWLLGKERSEETGGPGGAGGRPPTGQQSVVVKIGEQLIMLKATGPAAGLRPDALIKIAGAAVARLPVQSPSASPLPAANPNH